MQISCLHKGDLTERSVLCIDIISDFVDLQIIVTHTLFFGYMVSLHLVGYDKNHKLACKCWRINIIYYWKENRLK